MKRTFVVLCLVMLFAMFSMAQSSSSSATNDQSSAQSSTQPSSPSQSSPSTDSQAPSSSSGSSMGAQAGSSSSATAGAIEGCIVKAESDFYLQPIAGGSRVKLSSSDDLSAHVGHHVRLQGSEKESSSASSPSASGASNPSGSASSSGSTASAAQEFAVTRVDMVSTTCPASADKSNPK